LADATSTGRSRFDDGPIAATQGATAEQAAVQQFFAGLNEARDGGRSSSLPSFPDSAADALSDERLIGPTFGHFSILKKLGSGGYAIVYLAQDPTLNRCVALKIPRPETLLSKSARYRFMAEGQTVSSLDHPNILKVYEAAQIDGIYYIASEYCAGPNLHQWLMDQGSAMGPRQAANVVAELADAVEHAHTRGILHRDLKPSNVLLHPTDEVRGAACEVRDAAETQSQSDGQAGSLPYVAKLADFGIAKIFDETDDHTRTMTGTVLGSPSYMSPEQASGRSSLVGPRSDVYGLGAILHELLTGKPPFEGDNRAAVLHNVLNEEPVRLRSANKEIPRDLEAICFKCLEKQPDGRYRTAAELRDDLRRFLDGVPVSARPLTATHRMVRWSRRRPASAALVLLGCLTVVGFAIGGWWVSLRLQREIESTQEARDRADARGREAERERAAVEVSNRRLRRDVFCLDAHAAFRAVTGGRRDYAVELLNRYADDPSITATFVWRYLWRLCHQAVHVWSEPGLECNSVAFSPDGTRLAAGIENGTAPIWDVATGKEVQRLRGHSSCVNTVRFTPDGKRLATASCDGSVRLWDAASGRQERILLQGSAPVLSLAISSDGQLLATGANHKPIYLFRLPDGAQVGKATVDYGTVDDVAFSADNKLLAITAGDRVSTWRVSQFPHGELRRDGEFGGGEKGEFPESIRAISFARGGSLIACAGDHGTIHIADLNRNLRAESVLHGYRRARTVLLDRTGRRLLCAGEGRIVEIWDIESRTRIGELYGHTRRITDVVLDPHERLAASASFDGSVRLWSMDKADQSKLLPAVPGADQMAFAAGGSLLLLGGGGKVRAFDTTSWQEKFTYAADRFAVSVGPAGEFLATFRNGRCVVQNVRTGESVGSMVVGPREQQLTDLTLSADGRHIILADNHSLDDWDIRSQAAHENVGTSAGKFLSLALSPRESTVLASSDRDAFEVFQLDLFKPRRPRDRAFGSVGVVRQLRYSADGSLFAGASEDRAVYVWESRTNKLKVTLIGHEEPVNCLAFSPRGKTLASGDDRGRVRLWDLESNQAALVLRAHPKGVKAVAFSPNGKLLVTATAYSSSGDGEVRIWPADRAE
jgi:eukaryotic-like serine/threonine-protein kinase